MGNAIGTVRGRWVRPLRRRRRYSIRAAAEKGVAVISGRAGVTPEMAVRLEKALGSTADTWLRMQMNYDLAQIRKREASIKVSRLAPV